MVVASCLHTLTEQEGLGINIIAKSFDRAGQHAISYMVVCTKCFEWHRKKRLLLNTKEAQDKWMKSGYIIKDDDW